MISRTVAILLAILGLYLSALQASAQPRGGGWRGRGGQGFARFGGGRFAGGGGGGFRGFPAGGYAPGGGGRRGFAGPNGGFGGYPQDFRARSYPGYGGPTPRAPVERPYGYGPGPARGFDGGWGAEQDEVRRAVREGRHIPLSQAIEAVRRRAPGRELDAGLEAGPNGRPVYRLRWAGQNGRRQDYVVDAGTGQVLGVQGGP